MNAITKHDLEAVVERINRATNSPPTPYTKTGDKYVSNIGNYHLDWAYGGVRLVRMNNEGGGIQSILPGFVSKRELYEKMQAFLRGVEAVTA